MMKVYENSTRFCMAGKPDTQALNAALVESVRQKGADHQDIFRSFFARNGQAVVDAARTIADVYRHNGRLFSMGNGGSSCDAAHVAVEFLHPITAGRPALTAIDLTCDSAMMTAIGNDVGFDHIFVRQILAQGRPGDGLIGISTSGNSANLVRAFPQGEGDRDRDHRSCREYRRRNGADRPRSLSDCRDR